MPKRIHPTTPRYCLFCKKIIKRPLRPKSKFYISWKQYQKLLFCNYLCNGKWRSLNKTGKNDTNWKSSLSKCIDCHKLLNFRYNRPVRCFSCYKKFKTGKNNPNWKNGKRFDKSGYILILKPDHMLDSIG